jgi:hypothetical protein
LNTGSTAGDRGADDTADADRRERDEAGAAVRVEVLLLCGGPCSGRLLVDQGVRRGRVDGSVRARRVADPEDAEDDRDGGAEDHRRPAHHQPDEDDGDADREADGPEALPRRGVAVVVRALAHSLRSTS